MSQKNQPEPAAIDLYYEYEMDGAPVTRLTMRPPRVRDVRDAQRGGGSDAENELRLFANLCEAAPEFLADLHMRDYLAVREVYEAFLGRASV